MDNSVLPLLAQLGIAAPFVIALWVFFNRAYNREVTRADRLEKQLEDLNKNAIDKQLPAMHETASALREVALANNELKTQAEIERRVAEALAQQRGKAGA